MNLEEYDNYAKITKIVDKFPFVEVDIERVKDKTGLEWFMIGIYGKERENQNVTEPNEFFAVLKFLKNDWVKWFKNCSNVVITEIKSVKVNNTSKQLKLGDVL